MAKTCPPENYYGALPKRWLKVLLKARCFLQLKSSKQALGPKRGHSLRVIEREFGHSEMRYEGLKKNIQQFIVCVERFMDGVQQTDRL